MILIFHTAQNKTPFFDLSKIGHDICLVTNLEVAREIPATCLHFRMFLQCVVSTKGIRGPCIKKNIQAAGDQCREELQ